jgi:hypothetical protein
MNAGYASVLVLVLDLERGDMNWDTISKVAIAVLPVLGIVLQLIRRPDGRRGQVKRDLELLGLLPDDSSSRSKLLQHIDQSVERLIVDEDELRRDPTGIGLAVFFLISTSVLVVFAIRSGDWWLWPIVAFLGLFGVIGLRTPNIIDHGIV